MALFHRVRRRLLTRYQIPDRLTGWWQLGVRLPGTKLAAATYIHSVQVAAMYAANKLWQEALDGYTALVRNKAVPQGAR